MEFSPELAKALRLDAGLSRVKAAESAGLSRQGLVNIEDGASVPGADTLARLAVAYGASPEDFYVFHDVLDQPGRTHASHAMTGPAAHTGG